MYYINFYFRQLSYNESEITGKFEAPDSDVVCSFSYNRNTEEVEIWDNNKTISEIEPLPVYWLISKLKENGTLKETECKISY